MPRSTAYVCDYCGTKHEQNGSGPAPVGWWHAKAETRWVPPGKPGAVPRWVSIEVYLCPNCFDDRGGALAQVLQRHISDKSRELNAHAEHCHVR